MLRNIRYWRLSKVALATTPLVAFLVAGISFFLPSKEKRIVVLDNHHLAKREISLKKSVTRKPVELLETSIHTEYVAPTPEPTPLPTDKPVEQISLAKKSLPANPTTATGFIFYESGIASFYTIASSSNKTASGAPFDESKLTVAHKTLKFGTVVKIINLNNQRQVIATVTDRGPYVPGRIIDLSPAANAVLQCNICPIRLEVKQ